MTYHHPAAVSLLLASLLIMVGGCATSHRSVPGIPAPQLTDGVSGAKLDLKDILPLLSASKHIYVGETHDSRADHQVQLSVLKTLAAMGHQVVIGVEWLPHTSQGALSQWMAEPLNKENFLQLTDWDKVWGFDIELYWPILRWAHENRVPVIGLNAPHNLVFGFAQHGRAGLTPEDQALLPPLDSANEAHRAYFVDMMRKAAQSMQGANHHAGFEKHIDAYYQAQLIWDETMAREVSELLRAPEHRLHTIVVFAGRAHVDFGLGIPERVLALSKHDYLTISPATQDHPPTTEAEEQEKGRPVARAHMFWWAE